LKKIRERAISHRNGGTRSPLLPPSSEWMVTSSSFHGTHWELVQDPKRVPESMGAEAPNVKWHSICTEPTHIFLHLESSPVVKNLTCVNAMEIVTLCCLGNMTRKKSVYTVSAHAILYPNTGFLTLFFTGTSCRTQYCILGLQSVDPRMWNSQILRALCLHLKA
jgi:hypothetical protein